MKRLLIVDDQQGIRLLLNEVLKKEGYITYLAANGVEALRYAEEEEIDCVLLDMKIPGMDGIEILKHLKEKWPQTPVFMMTAYGELDVVQEALELGAIRYFTKPFDIFEVRDEVNKTLKGQTNRQ
ncbi:response regulator [Lysinibacillus sphaericus]|uniref:Sporulation initiation phosphotransferase F n=1 Tax=Lysinibacillus sphaericus OT4b.31 TaxID=1285586 RepID=R7ZIX6_LYSSH|nr:response regulator [Lysinibacillus sphaericus]EON73994.1 sporulation initiation phosphotransferase F [Lysinibacillus sphaericus OT4b.31]